MKKFDRDSWASLFFLGAGIGICLLSSMYEVGSLGAPGPGFIGLCSGLAISFWSIIGFFSSWQRRVKEEKKFFGALWLNSFFILLLLLGFALLLNFLGFLICTFLFIFVLLAKTEAYSWKAVVAWSLGTAMVLFLIFQLWLQTQLPVGLLRYFGM